jgi:DNA polymerase elongation subunit (family B)
MIEDTYKEYGAECVYGDTDSTMVIFRKIPNTEEGYLQVFKLGEEAAALVSNAFHPAIVLENEKVYRKVIMLKKKHYVAISQESPSDPPKLDVKGVMMVRRDFSTFQQAVYSRVIDALIKDEAPEKGLSTLEKGFSELLGGTVDFEDLVLTRQLAKDYKNENTMQLVVAQKAEKRNPGNGPKPGDRVAFVPVVLASGHSNAAMYQKVEDASYAKEQGLPIDYHYYIKSFSNSMGDLFEAFRSDGELRELIDRYEGLATARRHGNMNVLDFFPSSTEQVPTTTGGVKRHIKTSKGGRKKRSTSEKLDDSKHAMSVFNKAFGPSSR